MRGVVLGESDGARTIWGVRGVRAPFLFKLPTVGCSGKVWVYRQCVLRGEAGSYQVRRIVLGIRKTFAVLIE